MRGIGRFHTPGLVRAGLIACLLLAALPGAAVADAQVVSLVGCHFVDDSSATVAAGEPVVIRWGWAAKTRGLVTMTVGATDQTVTVDGLPIADVDDYWGKPEQQANGTWRALWAYEVGTLDDVGDTVTVTLQVNLTHPTLDLLLFEGNRPVITPAGDVFGEVLSCVITAA